MRNNLGNVLCGKLKDGEEVIFICQAGIHKVIRQIGEGFVRKQITKHNIKSLRTLIGKQVIEAF